LERGERAERKGWLLVVILPIIIEEGVCYYYYWGEMDGNATNNRLPGEKDDITLNIFS
jgi:hypothetical protein